MSDQECNICGGHGGYNVKVGSVEETFPCPDCSSGFGLQNIAKETVE